MSKCKDNLNLVSYMLSSHSLLSLFVCSEKERLCHVAENDEFRIYWKYTHCIRKFDEEGNWKLKETFYHAFEMPIPLLITTYLYTILFLFCFYHFCISNVGCFLLSSVIVSANVVYFAYIYKYCAWERKKF